jgi:hypothetical protein
MKKEPQKTLLFLSLIFFLMSISACQTLRRKFTRKPKKQIQSQEEPIVAFEEYPQFISSQEQQYKYYFSLWKSWHLETIELLKAGSNRKRLLSSLKEEVENLKNLKAFINPPKQKELFDYILSLEEIKDSFLNSRLSEAKIYQYKMKLESLGRQIERKFSYRKIKPWLK